MDIHLQYLTDADVPDFTALLAVFAEVFEWEHPTLPRAAHLQKVLGDSTFIALVAKVESVIIGGLTAHILNRYDTEKPSAYIYDIAILPAFQRQGIGTLLIQKLHDYCRENGFSEMFVQAETDDTQAVNFYQKTEITTQIQAVHFTYSFDKELF
ncbi:MAG: GNAT family N-acetyltransferase [Candidatus Kapaibacterium sp.]|nr:MAG: GNAT family N-acetyltransferase [Candidatus Kapabacteria bacterium]